MCNIIIKYILNNIKNCDEIMIIYLWRYENKDILWMLLIFFFDEIKCRVFV